MKIAFVVNALTTGGAEIHSMQLAEGLRKSGHKCFIFALLPGDDVFFGDEDRVAIGSNGLFNFSAQRLLNKMIFDISIDLIVAVNGRPSAYAQLARNWEGARFPPIVTIYHTTQLFGYRQKVQHLIHRHFINGSDALVFVSSNQQAYCKRIGLHGRRATTIRNGVDGSRFNSAARSLWRETKRAELGLTPEHYVIGQSAMFRPEKNHQQSVRVLKALRTKAVPAVLLLIGDGPLRANIEMYAKHLDVADAVIFAGRQHDVLPYLAAFDVGILTSTAVETFSLAALEFMALGVPGVLSDIGGANEMVINGSTGQLFPTNDDQALLRILDELADRRVSDQLGAAAAENVASNFTLDAMISKYEQLFLELVACV